MHLVGVDLMGVDLVGVYLIGVDLIGMGSHRRGSRSHRHACHGRVSPTGELWIISLNKFVCEVTPQANSPSPEFALEIAPLIHSGQQGQHLLGTAGQTSPKPLQPPNLLAVDGQCSV